MIAFLTGRVAAKAAMYALLDVGGVGYKLLMSTPSLAALPSEGDEVTVHTYLYVREDELTLFGFESQAEKEAFERLITVSGIGPKVALATLSSLSPDVLATAIAAGDDGLISSVPGIGKKTAQRIILDLQGKFAASDLSAGVRAADGSSAALSEATEALLAMGISSAEASVALNGYDGPAGDTQARVRFALRRLGGSR